jgi:hypothetical protein
MRGRNVRFVASLAVCVLLPVISAVAKDSISRPFYIQGHFQQIINLSSSMGTTAAEGTATHLGRSTLQGFGYQGDFFGTIVAANGDEISFHFSDNVISFAGGTGRFKNVSGECSIVANILRYVDDGTTLTITGDFTGSGTITY